MDNLNKENFFNALAKEYPEQMKAFCDWIDEYKKTVEWAGLFKDAVKFHDIPYEMQHGIICRWLRCNGYVKTIYTTIGEARLKELFTESIITWHK